MAVIEQRVSLKAATVGQVQEELRAYDLDGWLLYNFHGLNPIASSMLGLPALSRRHAVLIPAEGSPVALTHRIEQQPWEGWLGECRVYGSWRELEGQLTELLSGLRTVAMEYSPADAVPYVDLVPAGVIEMVRAAGVEVRSSAELVSSFYSRWTLAGEASHRRAAVILKEAVHAAFGRIAAEVRGRNRLTEWELREWIRADLEQRGLAVGVDCIAAVNANAANPHYGPTATSSAPIREGDLVLIDLWGKENDKGVYADQTWMCYVGTAVPERLTRIWNVLHEAREAAVALLLTRHEEDRPLAGWEVDDAAREVITRHGYGDYFVHRTGHSIDRELHGTGPNIDNLETRDTRRLIPGIGFSIEPGIYIPGDVGFRSEINVFIGRDGPEVTTPDRQREVFAVLAGR
jgi:Xaa-Pro dipeptidase